MSCSARIKMLPLQGLLWLYLIFFGLGHSTLQPGYLDFDNLPDTNFSCIGKVIGGYYADLEANCQMFHVCTIGQHDEPMDIRFLCLNGTVFDQETRVCERVDEVDCSKSEKFYSLNLELYGNTAPPILEEPPETESPSPSSTTTKRPTTTSRTTTHRPTTFRPSTFGYRPPLTTSTTTASPPRTTSPGPKVITSHHFPVSESPSTQNQDPFREINLDPDTPPDIRFDPRQPISFQHSAFNGGETHITVTTHTALYKDNQNYQRPHQANKPSGFQQTNYPQPLYERPENTQDNKFVGFPHLISLKDGPTHFKFPQLLQTTTENYIITTPRQSSLLIRLRNHQKTSTTQRPYAQHSSNKNELVFRQKFPVSESEEEDDANSHQFNRQTPASRPYHSQTNEPFATHYLPQLQDDDNRNHQITFRANNGYRNGNSNFDSNIRIDHPHGHSAQDYEGNNKPQGFHYQTRGPGFKPTHRIPEGPRRSATQRVPIDETGRPVTQRIVEETRRSTLRIVDEPITQRIVAEASRKIVTEGESRRPNVPDEETEKVAEDLKKVIVSEEPRRTVSGTAASTTSIKTEAPPKLQIPLPIVPINLPQPFTLDSRHFETKRHQPSLPRVIVSASATVSDASGRKLNITLGTIDPIHVLGTPPSSYDDYKEEDVVLDPFYHDVKKIKNKKLKRDVNYDEFIIEDPREFNENLRPVTQNSVPVVTGNDLPKFRGLRKRNAADGATTHWTPPDYVDDNYEPTVYNESDIFSDGNYDEYDYPTSEDAIVFDENATDRNVDYLDIMPEHIVGNYTVGNNVSKTNITTEKYPFDESKAFTSKHLNSSDNKNDGFSVSTTTERHSKTTAATVLIPKLNVDGEDPVEMAENEEIKEIENCTKSKFVDNKILLAKDDLYNIFENDTMTTEYLEETTEFNSNATTDTIDAVAENRSEFDSSTSVPATTVEGGDLEFKIFTSEINNSKTAPPENSNSTYEHFNINDTSLPFLSKERTTAGFSSSEKNSTENFVNWDRSFDDSTTDNETEKHSTLEDNIETTEMLFGTTEVSFNTEKLIEFSHSEFSTTEAGKETTEHVITTTEIPVTDEYDISVMETTVVHTTDIPTTTAPTTTEKRIIEKTTPRNIYNRPRKHQSVSDFLRNSAKGRPHFGSNHDFGALHHGAPHVKDAAVKESVVSEMKITFDENLTGQILNASNPGSEKELKDALSSIMINPMNMSESFELNNSTETSDLIQATVVPPEDRLKSTSPLLLKSATPTDDPNLQSDHLQRTTLSLLSVSSTENVLKNIDRFKLSFTCLGKKLNQFYNDVRDCRLFHYCSPGYSPTQVLDLKFVCDKGTFFDFEHLKCSTEKPRNCL